MPRLIFIRPAETDYVLADRVMGRSDVDLNENGRIQAFRLAESLAGLDINFVAVSPLKRAISTAMCIEDEIEGLNITPYAGFQGADMGEWETKCWGHIRGGDSSRYKTWLTDPDFRAPGGESMREVYARAYSDIVNIVQQSREGELETIALVLEETVLQAMLCAAMDLPLEVARRFEIEPGAYATFQRIYPGGPYRMMSWNRTEHLPRAEPGLKYDEEISGIEF